MTDEQFNRLMDVLDGIGFYLGALATHSQTRLRMMAEEQGVRCVWWDPHVEPWPFDGKHGEGVPILRVLHLGIPREKRRKR